MKAFENEIRFTIKSITLQSSLTQWLYSEVSYSRKLDQTFAHEKSNDDISPV